MNAGSHPMLLHVRRNRYVTAGVVKRSRALTKSRHTGCTRGCTDVACRNQTSGRNGLRDLGFRDKSMGALRVTASHSFGGPDGCTPIDGSPPSVFNASARMLWVLYEHGDPPPAGTDCQPLANVSRRGGSACTSFRLSPRTLADKAAGPEPRRLR